LTDRCLLANLTKRDTLSAWSLVWARVLLCDKADGEVASRVS